MKKLLIILAVTLGLNSPAKADTIWTLVNILLLDDYGNVVKTTVFKDIEDCRSAAVQKFMAITSEEKGIQVQNNTLTDPVYITAMLLQGNGKLSGSSSIYIIKCIPSNPIK